MKVFPLMLSLSALCAITAAAGHKNHGHPLHMSFSAISEQLGTHEMTKRQADSTTEGHCEELRKEELCTNGYFQEWINLIFPCDKATAKYLHEACQVDPKGKLCGATSVVYNRSVCDGDSCTGECRDHLINIQNELGCCIDTLNVPQTMWSNCSVEPVTPECPYSSTELPENGTTLSPQDCQMQLQQQEQQLYSTVYCNYSYIFAVDEVLSTEGCHEDFYEKTLPLCFANKAGQYCFTDLADKVKKAAQYCTSVNNCSSSCEEALTDLLGFDCCLNAYNGTVDGAWSSYELWMECGLESPGFCEAKLTDDVPITDDPISGDEELTDIPTSGDEELTVPGDGENRFSGAPACQSLPGVAIIVVASVLAKVQC